MADTVKSNVADLWQIVTDNGFRATLPSRYGVPLMRIWRGKTQVFADVEATSDPEIINVLFWGTSQGRENAHCISIGNGQVAENAQWLMHMLTLALDVQESCEFAQTNFKHFV